MWGKVVTGLVASSLLLTATQSAFADPYGWHRGWRGGWHEGWRGHDDGERYDYAQVVNVEPIIHEVRVSTPRQECWTETQYEQVEYHTAEPHSTVGSTVLGGLIGAALGNQIGRGDGRRIATVAGALVGSAIGHDVAQRRNGGYVDSSYTEVQPRDIQRCQVRYDDTVEQHIDGYRVTYVYGGREFTTRVPYDPGDHIRVRVDVEPEHCN